MINLQQVLVLIERHRAALAQIRKPGLGEPSPDDNRWSFLVTLEELNGLVDEMVAKNMFAEVPPALVEANVTKTEYLQAIREGRAALHINGTAILPELMNQVPETLNG